MLPVSDTDAKKHFKQCRFVTSLLVAWIEGIPGELEFFNFRDVSAWQERSLELRRNRGLVQSRGLVSERVDHHLLEARLRACANR
jgi:hypothetical protein